MRLVVVSGTSGSGKTSVLLHTIRELKSKELNCGVVKIDCLQTDDLRRFKKEGIPVKVGISGDMCPDHFAIFNFDEMIEWGLDKQITIVETAGLCLRCTPYTDKCLAVCVIDVTSGPNMPLKIGPMLTTADIVILTKGDLVSQAEREVFREKTHEVNKTCRIIDANGLSGMGAAELADLIEDFKIDVDIEMKLRHTPPLSVCTICTGETRTSKKFHIGVLKHLNGFSEYVGE